MRGSRRRSALLAAAASVAAALAACSTSAPTAGPSSGPTNVAAATASAEPLASFGPPPSPSPDDAAPVVIDSTLLSILPAAIGSTPVQEELDAAAAAVNDLALDGIASAVDAGVAVDAGNGNLVLATVVRLRPGAFGDEVFRQWRDTFDEGACNQSGGVVGHAEAEIAGRKTFVTSCAMGMHTYHVWLQDQGILISASSIGDGRFGEQLLEGLRVTP